MKRKNTILLIVLGALLFLLILAFSLFRSDPIKGSPSQCQFIRGDSDSDGRVTITDSIKTIKFLFDGGSSPECLDSADVDDNGRIDITDAIYTLNFLFTGGPQPPQPYPNPGTDPTLDGLTCNELADSECTQVNDNCAFGRISSPCKCGAIVVSEISEGDNEYCLFDQVTTKPTSLNIYAERPRSQVNSEKGHNIRACSLIKTDTEIIGCNPYEKDSKELYLTKSSNPQINPSSYFNLNSPGSQDTAIMVWQESESGINKIYWCNLAGLQKPQDCETNKILIGDGLNPSIGGVQDQAYIVWEKEDLSQSRHEILACNPTLDESSTFSCFEGSNKILIRERDITGLTYQVISNPISKHGYILFREKYKNPETTYELHSCRISNNLCIPQLAAGGKINLPQPGDILEDGSIMYAINNEEGFYDIYYHEINEDPKLIRSNLDLISTPQLFNLKRNVAGTIENLKFAVWKNSDPGRKYRINIKLINEETQDNPPVIYEVIPPGYTGANGPSLSCDNPNQLCITMDKIIGPFEETTNREDKLTGNFQNEFFTCDLSALVNYDPHTSQQIHGCLRRV